MEEFWKCRKIADFILISFINIFKIIYVQAHFR